MNEEELSVKCYGQEITLRARDDKKHELIQKYLLEKNIKFHSFTPRSQRPVKLVIKGIPVDIEPAEVQKMFSVCGLTTARISRLYKPTGGKNPPPFVATPSSKEDIEKFMRTTRILNFRIKIEKLRRRRRGQLICYRCQRTGHSSHVCHREVACRKCGESHNTEECVSSNIKCARCGGPHKATDPTCPKLLHRSARTTTTQKEQSNANDATQSRPRPAPTTQAGRPRKTYAAAAKPAAQDVSQEPPQAQHFLLGDLLAGLNTSKVRSFLDAYQKFKSPPPGADILELKMDAVASMLCLSSP